jgi:hypothetical protein
VTTSHWDDGTAVLERGLLRRINVGNGSNGGGSRLRHFKIAEHDVIAARAELADFSDRGRLSRRF